MIWKYFPFTDRCCLHLLLFLLYTHDIYSFISNWNCIYVRKWAQLIGVGNQLRCFCLPIYISLSCFCYSVYRKLEVMFSDIIFLKFSQVFIAFLYIMILILYSLELQTLMRIIKISFLWISHVKLQLNTILLRKELDFKNERT